MGCEKNAGFICFSLFSACSLQAAAPSYFLTTAAGYVTPLSTPIALNQPPVASLVTYDAKGNLYYAGSSQIWRLNADGTETLIAGAYSSNAQFVEGEQAVDAPISGIFDFKFDSLNDLYINSFGAKKVFKVSPSGAITTFAGNGSPASAGIPAVGPNIAPSSIPLSVDAIAIDANNTVYLKVETGNVSNICWQVLSAPPGGGSTALVASGGPLGSGQSTSCPTGVDADMVIDGSSLFTAQTNLAQATAGGTITYRIVLSNGPSVPPEPISTSLGSAFSVAPNGSLIFFNSSGGLEAMDSQSLSVEAVPKSTGVTKVGALAVNPVTGDVAVTSGGTVNVFTLLSGNYAAVACNAPVFAGDNGPATLALMQQRNLLADVSGDLYVADTLNYRIRKITPGGIITTIAGIGTSGATGDHGAALQAEIFPGQMALDGSGNLYFINLTGGTVATIRKVDRNGIITTVAGGGADVPVNGARATSLLLDPTVLASDGAGDLFFDTGLQLWELNTSGTIQLVAGTGIQGAITIGAPAISEPLHGFTSVAVSNSGTIYFGNITAVWMIDANGNLQDVAGQNLLRSPFINQPIQAGPAPSVLFDFAEDLVIDPQGNLYFYADTISSNPQVVMVDTSGNLTPIGGGGSAAGTSSGDGGDAIHGTFQNVYGLALDATGSLYVSDLNVVRKMTPYNSANPPPFLAAGGVVGAGGSFPAVAAVSAGGEVSIFGGNFVSAANAHTVTNADLVNGKIPTNLAGVCASFGGSPAAMLGVYPGQLNVQVGTLAPGAVNVQVTTNCGTPQALTSNYSGVVVQAASPEFYSFKPDPIGGQNPIAAVNALTGAFIGPPNLLPGAIFVAAKTGDIVQAYGTGFGATSPAYGLGVIPGAAGTLTYPYSLTLGGVPIPAPNIAYAGISPCCAGFYQVDFTVPQGIPSGAQALVITIAGVDSPPLAYIQLGQ